MNIIIDSAYNNLSKSEKMIADYFLSHEKELITMSIHDVAVDIGISPSSISRFVKKLFGKNFSQTKIEIAKMIEQKEIQSASEILDWAEDYDQIHNKIIYQINKVCVEVVSYNGINTFKAVIQKIVEAESIYLFGIGNSSIIAYDLCQKLMKLKKRVIYMTDTNYGLISSMSCTPKDVAIAISSRGRTAEVNLAAQKAKEKGAFVVALTGKLSSPLKKLADIAIITPNEESTSSSRLAAIFSRYSMLFAVDMLFIGAAKSIGNDPNEILKEYNDIFKELYKKKS